MSSESQPESLSQRQQSIVDWVRRHGYATIETMAEEFSVSAQTIRREIIELNHRRILQRHHGGASLPAGFDNLDYSFRQIKNADEKKRIGKHLAKEISNESSIFIDIGTTTEAVSKALITHKGLKVITNHMSVASVLCENTDFDIILTGGLVRNRDRALTGEDTSEFIKKFKVNYAILGIGSITSEGNLLDYDYRDFHVSKTAISIAEKKFIVADHTKFNSKAIIQTAHFSDIDAIFTDIEPQQELMRLADEHNVQIYICN